MSGPPSQRVISRLRERPQRLLFRYTYQTKGIVGVTVRGNDDKGGRSLISGSTLRGRSLSPRQGATIRPWAAPWHPTVSVETLSAIASVLVGLRHPSVDDARPVLSSLSRGHDRIRWSTEVGKSSRQGLDRPEQPPFADA